VSASIAVFAGIFVLIILIDYIELTRRTAGNADASALLVAQTAFYRVPQLLERLMPFCILVAAMSCYLGMSRRLELVVARAAGISAWQFIMPALLSALALGALSTTVYSPLSAEMSEQAKRNEAILFPDSNSNPQDASGFWLNQVTQQGQTIINSIGSQQQGKILTGLTIFRFNPAGQFSERIEAREATLEPGYWAFKTVKRYTFSQPTEQLETYSLATNLTREQIRGSFATPETVSFWDLPEYITSSVGAGQAIAGYRLQYQKLLVQPLLLASMVMLASAVSLRFFRLGGVQKMVLSGVAAGFLLYVVSKITEDLSKAELMHPVTAAWLPVCIGSLVGLLAMLHQEDG
jgi:lipopolysaccharide export system permease protein